MTADARPDPPRETAARGTSDARETSAGEPGAREPAPAAPAPAKRGRPRRFDRDAALESALLEFWRHGYDATSIATLTRAMGVNPPSLYAAFGDKRQLFGEAVRRYVATYGGYGARALAEPTARAAVARMLRDAAAAYTGTGTPAGCLLVNGAATCGPGAEEAEAELRAVREGTKAALAAKVEADVRAGRLPAGTDARALAGYAASVAQGMCVQARDGAGRAELERVAELALAAWPAETPDAPGTPDVPDAPERAGDPDG
jgi:AcrR family transcriptional regulator